MPTPTKIWYVDTTATPNASWIGPYGTGELVNSWSSVTKAANNWYFGLGGQTAPAGAFWNNTYDDVRIGAYGTGLHKIDFSAATMPGSPSRYSFRSRNPGFTLENLHIVGQVDYNHIVMVSDNGADRFLMRNCKIEGPGYRGTSWANASSGAWSCLNINPATAGDFRVIDNEFWGTNAGITLGGEVPPTEGLFLSNYIHDLSKDYPSEGDCITIGAGGTAALYDALYKVKFIKNTLTGWCDHAFDTVGGKRLWFEGNSCENDGSANNYTSFGGLVLGGNQNAAGMNFVFRNRIILTRPSGYVNSVIGINTRYGSDNLCVANLVVAETSAYRDEDGTFAGCGERNQAIQCTFVSTGTTINDTPVYNVSGNNGSLTNCALITSGTNVVRQSAGADITLYGCKTNGASFTYGTAPTLSGSNNTTGRTMPTGPDYFPTAHLLGTGDTVSRVYSDWYGVQLSPTLVGGLAPDARTTAAEGVTRKWWKGWTAPGVVLA